MNRHRCDTLHQFYVYTWIQDNFYLELLTLYNIDSHTILLRDGKTEAYISYMDNNILVKYSDSDISVFPLKKNHNIT